MYDSDGRQVHSSLYLITVSVLVYVYIDVAAWWCT